VDIKGFVEKAKDAATAAAERAKAAAAGAADQAKEVMAGAARLSEIQELGAEKIQELILSFQQALPAIEVAGYELTEFELELGVTPKLIPHFRHAARSAEDVDRAREALRDNALGSLVLGGLLKAGEIHKHIRVAGFSFAHIELELGLIPSVRLQYKNEAPDRRLLEVGPAPAQLPSPSEAAGPA
jgi:hypothetical protein